MIRFVGVVLVAGILIFIVVAVWPKKSSVTERVNTEEQAVQIAKQSWISIYEKTQRPIYSSSESRRFEPYHAILINDTWVVTGTIPDSYEGEYLVTEITFEGKASVVSMSKKLND